MRSQSLRSDFLDRRRFLAGSAAAAAVAARPAGAAGQSVSGWRAILNPLVLQRADAQISRHPEGYYMTASVPEYDRLVLRRAPTLAGLHDAEEAVLWRRPAAGKMGGHIWAPELHKIDGRWYMYFAAGNSDSVFHIRTYVMRCQGSDPMFGPWDVLGAVETPWDAFNLDSTSFEHRGVRYFCWAQHEPGIDTNSNIYLAPLASPTTLARPPARLTVPTLPWEVAGEKVNEAPAFLAHDGKVFITYSAGATDARYCLGMLTASADADLMDAASWTKSPVPVFVTCAETKVYGPGHNGFTVDEEGRDILVYHGRDYERIVGKVLYDPNRHTRVQRIYYRPDGSPDFGIPVGNGPLPIRLATDTRKTAFLVRQDAALGIGGGSLPASQFREIPGLAGAGTVSLQPVNAPLLRLLRTPDGNAALAAVSGGKAFAAGTSFIRHSGLSDPAGVSYACAAKPDAYLLHGAQTTVRPVPAGEAARATWFVD